jgi:hypothetical protein
MYHSKRFVIMPLKKQSHKSFVIMIDEQLGKQLTKVNYMVMKNMIVNHQHRANWVTLIRCIMQCSSSCKNKELYMDNPN